MIAIVATSIYIRTNMVMQSIARVNVLNKVPISPINLDLVISKSSLYMYNDISTNAIMFMRNPRAKIY